MAELFFKILIIGDKEVGRSTLLEKQFKLQTATKSGVDVVGVNHYTMILTLERIDIRITIWYISYADKFSSVLPNFIMGACGVVLMFDLTKIRTLQFLSKYPELIREIQGDIPLLLLGNKVDLEGARAVTRAEATSFAGDHNLTDYKEISAKTGQNCENIFEILAENILKQKQLE
jgi:small GTP-binding protein